MQVFRKDIRKYGKLTLVVIISLMLMLSSTLISSATMVSDYKAYVMAPLEKITDWTAFKNQLITLKNNGVYALTTDVWWGYVEPNADNQFDWSYYKTYADTVRAAGIKWVPIISTHQCGGNVGDNVNIPLPAWLWTKDTADKMQYKDEAGNMDKQAIAPWWTGIAQQYDELYASFASNFSGYKDIIAKIYLSAGSSGELRYPSYNPSHGWNYPGRGYLECYTETAKTNFRNAMQTKYGTIAALNTAWGTSLTSFTQINPPSDGDTFFINGYKSNYGKDFLTWYQGSLTKHLATIASKAHARFDTVFGVRIGAKISGVHWRYSDPTMPHCAEYCAGYYNYSTILDQFKTSNLDLTFTCLEMTDSNTSPNYSMPKTLVIQVANLAKSKGIKINGENALAISNNPTAYQNCAEMAFNYNFSGFTLLRLANIVSSNGTATSEMAPFKDALVLKPVPVTFTINNANAATGQTVYVSGSRWELGKWTTGTYPLQLTKNASGQWVGTCYLGAGVTYEFKGIKKSSTGVVWEGGNNKVYTIPAAGGSYTWTWTN
ncbi:MAG: family 14 glycosylhydrolase [Clostridia bacterium]|nr:family 14 glycosylhydrolase [Clostridia bacterium]